MNSEAPLSAEDVQLLETHLVGASSCVTDMADLAFTNQCALAGKDLDSLMKRHAQGTPGVPAGVLRRFLASTDIGKTLSSSEFTKAFLGATDRSGCPFPTLLNVYASARGQEHVYREKIKGERRRWAASARSKRKRASRKGRDGTVEGQCSEDGDCSDSDERDSRPAKPTQQRKCTVCRQPGHNRRSPNCPGRLSGGVPPAASASRTRQRAPRKGGDRDVEEQCSGDSSDGSHGSDGDVEEQCSGSKCSTRHTLIKKTREGVRIPKKLSRRDALGRVQKREKIHRGTNQL
jgi:hypothetical protein